jgi:DNA-binding GntR family transcriptional regulator
MVVPRLDLADAEELYELREILEGRAARRAAERATPELHARLNALIKAFGHAHKQGSIDEMTAIDADFHDSLAAASGSTRLQRAVDTVRAQVHQVRLRTMRARGRPAKSLRELARLVTAVRARDGGRAEAAMREHIASVRADLASVMPDAP